MRRYEESDTYMCVYPANCATSMYINLYLLISACEWVSGRSAVSEKQVEMLLTVKIVHEVTHLVNHIFNRFFRGHPNEIMFPRSAELVTGLKTLKNREFTDAGDMMERVLFGAVIEINSSSYDDLQFSSAGLVGYEVVGDSSGKALVDTVATCNNWLGEITGPDTLRVNLGCKIKRQSRGCRLSSAIATCEVNLSRSCRGGMTFARC
jgi:hypothetical protein